MIDRFQVRPAVSAFAGLCSTSSSLAHAAWGLSELEYREVLQLRVDRADREDLAAQKTA